MASVVVSLTYAEGSKGGRRIKNIVGEDYQHPQREKTNTKAGTK